MDISIDIEGFQSFKAVWQKAPELTHRELLAATYEAEALLEREIKERTPTGATSILRGSIAAQEPLVLGDQVLGEVGTSISYAVPVEMGTKPHFPPVEALKDWVRAKLNVEDAAVDGVALSIARAIAVRGTLAVGMFNTGFAHNQEQIKSMYRRAHQRIVAGLQK